MLGSDVTGAAAPQATVDSTDQIGDTAVTVWVGDGTNYISVPLTKAGSFGVTVGTWGNTLTTR